MAGEAYEAAQEIKGSLNLIAEELEAGTVGHALEAIARELHVANQLTAYALMQANSADRDVRQEIRNIIAGQSII